MNRINVFVWGLWLTTSVGIQNVAAQPARSFRPPEGLFAPIVTVPIPKSGADFHKWNLGKDLYFEKKLSKSGNFSCNSCHRLDGYGVDNEATSPGHGGARGDRNSPTVLNAFMHLSQFWDGRAKDVEEQALGPILNPVEMAMDDQKMVLKSIAAIPKYPKAFKKAFPGQKDPLTFKNIGNAIGYFERFLVTPSRFDRFLKGDNNALSFEEKRGLKKFVMSGCAGCHNGKNLGGNTYQKMGVLKFYPTDDRGRAKVTGKKEDEYVFKVPSLRNVAKTYPYFHHGKVKDLGEAIRIMAEYQLGYDVGRGWVRDVEAFLKTLTGELDPEILKRTKQ